MGSPPEGPYSPSSAFYNDAPRGYELREVQATDINKNLLFERVSRREVWNVAERNCDKHRMRFHTDKRQRSPDDPDSYIVTLQISLLTREGLKFLEALKINERRKDPQECLWYSFHTYLDRFKGFSFCTRGCVAGKMDGSSVCVDCNVTCLLQEYFL